MRNNRNQSLEELGLIDDIPFSPEENDLELLTNNLENFYVRKIDLNLLTNKKKRLMNKKKIEQKDIDLVVLKSLLRLNNAVSDCLTYKHQKNLTEQQTIMRKISRDNREKKAKDLFKTKILEETQKRTLIRENKIKEEKEKRIKEITSELIKNREEEIKIKKIKKNKKDLEFIENNFEQIINIENEKFEKLFKNKKTLNKSKIIQKRNLYKENIENSLKELRKGLDILDSVTEKNLINNLIRKKLL